MSDLYKMIKWAREGYVEKGLMRGRIEVWERSHSGPVCCFFISKRNDVPKGYLNLPNYNLPGCPDDEMIIGCSRGCIPLSTSDSTYGPLLCAPCVEEAKKILGD